MLYKSSIVNQIGNTPMVRITDSYNWYAKLEGLNPFGSMKDRAAAYILHKAIKEKKINRETKIIESSSGNFAIALAAICSYYQLKFICVIDPAISDLNKDIIVAYGADIIMVEISDKNGSYVQSRIDKVHEILESCQNVYWTNQYDNPIIREAYRESLGEEIIKNCPDLEYLFIPVSTCGTIAGLSQRIKNHNKKTKIIAVDINTSSIFRSATGVRHIHGFGSSIYPGNLKTAQIDDVVIVNESECISFCRKLQARGLLVGASSGGTYAAMHRLLNNSTTLAVGIFPDRGERYLDTVFNNAWCAKHILDFTG